MMTILVGLPLLILAAVLQSTALVHLRVLDGTLDLTLLLVLGWTLAGDWRGGMVWGLMGGLCLDLLSGAFRDAAGFRSRSLLRCARRGGRSLAAAEVDREGAERQEPKDEEGLRLHRVFLESFERDLSPGPTPRQARASRRFDWVNV